MIDHGKRLEDLHCNKGFAFQSKAWREANLETVELTEVFRQSNKRFVEVFEKVLYLPMLKHSYASVREISLKRMGSYQPNCMQRIEM